MEIGFLTQDLIVPRQKLLQTCLRPGFDDYGIEHEYPIVLSPSAEHLSLCVYDAPVGGSKRLLAHANWWPRTLVQTQGKHPERVQVALIGNVATAPSHRGQGIMARLFDFLWAHALHAGVEALILWSDLVAFYHKLGFEACGRESRLFFLGEELQALPARGFKVEACRGERLDAQLLTKLLSLRWPTASYLERSPQEFRVLLSIPDTTLLLLSQGERLVGYGIVGKGVDLIGMVHEWGAPCAEGLLAMLAFMARTTRAQEVALLSPHALPINWRTGLAPYLTRIEEHPMALVKCEANSPARRMLAEGFLWGLDSI